MADVVEARGVPMAQVAIAWGASKPVNTAPIIGATKLRHLDDAVAALSIQLTANEIKHLAFYAGWPKAWAVIAMAKEIFD